MYSKKFIGILIILGLLMSSIPSANAICEARLSIDRAHTLTVPVGSVASGNVNSTHFKDGNVLNITETAGAPAFDVRLNYTGIIPPVEGNYTQVTLAFFVFYDGSPTHVVNFDAWNFDTKTWITGGQVFTNGGYIWLNFTAKYPNILPFIDDDLNAWVRIYHETNGNINHVLSIDYACTEVLYLVDTCGDEIPYYGRVSNPITSDKWISANEGAIYNASNEAYSLNWTQGNGYEDFTTYSESDSNGRLERYTDNVTFTNLQENDADTYTYDLKTGELDDFFLQFKFEATTINNSPTLIRMNILTGAESPDDRAGMLSTNKDSFGIQLRSINHDTEYWLMVVETNGGSEYNGPLGSNAMDEDTPYWITLNRTGTFLEVTVYTDEYITMDSQFDMTLQTDYSNVDYLLVPQSIGGSSAVQTSGYIKDLAFGDVDAGGFSERGIIYSTNLLTNVTRYAEHFIMNNSISTGEIIEVSFSRDNSTFERATNITCPGGSVYLKDLNMNPLYIKFRLFRGNLTGSSPLINSYEVLYSADCIGVVIEGLNPWDINWMLSLIWLVIMGIGVFKPDRIIRIFAGFFGLILGILLLAINMMVSIALICINLYLIYEGSK